MREDSPFFCFVAFVSWSCWFESICIGHANEANPRLNRLTYTPRGMDWIWRWSRGWESGSWWFSALLWRFVSSYWGERVGTENCEWNHGPDVLALGELSFAVTWKSILIWDVVRRISYWRGHVLCLSFSSSSDTTESTTTHYQVIWWLTLRELTWDAF